MTMMISFLGTCFLFLTSALLQVAKEFDLPREYVKSTVEINMRGLAVVRSIDCSFFDMALVLFVWLDFDCVCCHTRRRCASGPLRCYEVSARLPGGLWIFFRCFLSRFFFFRVVLMFWFWFLQPLWRTLRCTRSSDQVRLSVVC